MEPRPIQGTLTSNLSQFRDFENIPEEFLLTTKLISQDPRLKYPGSRLVNPESLLREKEITEDFTAKLGTELYNLSEGMVCYVLGPGEREC